MSCPSGIYTVNTNAQNVNAGSNVMLGTVIRRFGANLGQIGDGIIAKGKGYYHVNVDAVVSSATAGDYTLQILADGTPITGAKATVTLAADAKACVPVQAMVRLTCCEEPTTFQVLLTSTTDTNVAVVNNITVIVEKI